MKPIKNKVLEVFQCYVAYPEVSPRLVASSHSHLLPFPVRPPDAIKRPPQKSWSDEAERGSEGRDHCIVGAGGLFTPDSRLTKGAEGGRSIGRAKDDLWSPLSQQQHLPFRHLYSLSRLVNSRASSQFSALGLRLYELTSLLEGSLNL